MRNTSTDVEKTSHGDFASFAVGNTSTDVEKTARFSVMLIQPTLLFVVVVVKGGSLTN